MGASKAKNSAKRRELNREKRARQAQRRAEREHPNAAAIAPVRARLDAVLERKSRHVMGHGDVAKSLVLIERMRAEVRRTRRLTRRWPRQATLGRAGGSPFVPALAKLVVVEPSRARATREDYAPYGGLSPRFE